MLQVVEVTDDMYEFPRRTWSYQNTDKVLMITPPWIKKRQYLCFFLFTKLHHVWDFMFKFRV
jgi:hypothetical protein